MPRKPRQRYPKRELRHREVRGGNKESVKEHVHGENDEDESQDLLGEGYVPVAEDQEHGHDGLKTYYSERRKARPGLSRGSRRQGR